jgi:hypothetical protein
MRRRLRGSTARPEGAVARAVMAYARLLVAMAGLDDAGLRRRGPTRFGFVTSGWELLVAEAAHERGHAAHLAARTHRRSRWTPTYQPERGPRQPP